MGKTWSMVEEVVVDTVGSTMLRYMDPKYLVPIAIFILICMFALFMLILVNGYVTEINQTYLSPSSGADPHLCQNVLVANSGDFLLSTEGYWIGQPGFSYSESRFVASVKNVMISDAEYEVFVGYFQESIDYLAQEVMPSLDLGSQLLYWTSYVIPEPGSQTNRFFLNAHPGTIFDREYTAGALTNEQYDCKAAATGSFDPANNKLQVSFNIADYESSNCTRIAPPELLGYQASVSPGVFKIALDVRSLMTAVAVNLNVLSLSSLQYVTRSNYTVNFDGNNVTFSKYLDPRYPGMTPVLCLDQPLFSRCVVFMGSVPALPMFLHRGSSKNVPEVCDCAGEAKSRVNDPSYDCNLFQFLSGLLFYPTEDPTPLIELGVLYTDAELAAQSFAPMFAGSAFSANNPDYLTSESFRASAYDFCHVSSYDGSCSFVVFTSYDYGYSVNYAVSPNYNQIFNGSCGDTVSIPSSSW